jgi:hypothetical protein
MASIPPKVPLDPNKPTPPLRKLNEPGSGYTAVPFDELEDYLRQLPKEELISLIMKGANVCAFTIFKRDPANALLDDDGNGTEIDEYPTWWPPTLRAVGKKSGKKKSAKKSSKKSGAKSSKKAAKKRR